MKHTLEKISPSQVKIAVSVDKDLWKNAQEKAFNKVSAKVSVPGFRPGKAPKALLKERVNPEAVWNEAIENVLTPVYADVLQEEKINPATRPQVSITKLSDDELEVVYQVILVPEVTLGAYKGLKATRVAPSVTEKEVEEAIEKLLKGNAELVLSEKPAKMGDTVTMDFEGLLPDENGNLKPFDGGKASNYNLELGSHQFIPGFEEELVGMKSEEKKSFKITFPANYVKELAGKEATFNVTVHEIKEKVIPELNDAAVKELGIKDVETVDGLKEYEKKSLLTQKVNESENKYYNDLLSQIVEGSTFVIDPAIIAGEAKQMEENLKKQIEQNGLTFEQYLDITGTKAEDLQKTYLNEADKNIKTFLVTNKIGEAEKIEVTDKDVDAEIANMAKEYKMEEAQVRSILERNMDDYKSNLRAKKIREWILANAGSKEKAAEKEAAKEPAKKPAAKKAPAKKAAPKADK